MRHTLSALIVLAIGLAVVVQAQRPAPPSRDALRRASAGPGYRVDPFWPKPLPNKWAMQQIVDIYVDRDDHVWTINRRVDARPDELTAATNPPIHIIVENGHVTLDGVVNSNTDRMLARSIASSFGAFSVTNDLKTDAEAEQELEHL